MTTRRSILSAALAGMATVGGGVALAVARPDDTALRGLIADWLAAREAYRIAVDADVDAKARARARYPADLPPWRKWAAANHPTGEFDPFGERAPLTDAAMKALHDYGVSRRDAGVEVDPRGAEVMRLQRAVFAAGDADEIAYYKEVRPAYDQLLAQRRAAIAAIDADEGIAALTEARTAAYDRANDAHDALLFYEPATSTEFMSKAVALLRFPFGRRAYDPGDGEVDALIDDAERLIGGAS